MKTLKDILREDGTDYFESSYGLETKLRQSAIAWVKKISDRNYLIERCNDEDWRFTNERCCADEDECNNDCVPIQYKKVVIDFIKHFFNLEEDLK